MQKVKKIKEEFQDDLSAGQIVLVVTTAMVAGVTVYILHRVMGVSPRGLEVRSFNEDDEESTFADEDFVLGAIVVPLSEVSLLDEVKLTVVRARGSAKYLTHRLKRKVRYRHWRKIRIIAEDAQISIAERVQVILIEQLGCDESEIVPQARFREDLGVDSLDIVELIMAFEDEFGGEISDDEIKEITTVGEAIAWLEQNRQ